MIDIVITTCGRQDLLEQTINYIRLRTNTPYQLHIIDDASSNVAYLRKLAERDIARIYLNETRLGIPAMLRLVAKTGTSDPLVFTDDDVLCPLLEPDWLARGLEVMDKFPDIGLLGLNNPHCNIDRKRGETIARGPVTYCRNIPGTFVFGRRAVLQTCQPSIQAVSPVKAMCQMAKKDGWEVAYLTRVYCQHTGAKSVRKNDDWQLELDLVLPVDDRTLEPPEAYRW